MSERKIAVAEPQTRRGARILARNMLKRLQGQGYSEQQIAAMVTELQALIPTKSRLSPALTPTG
ncbi:MAG: hypothetical protein ACI9U2_002627 [Bradymonadia bacterium]|jgi:hypothetical protein